MNEISLKGTQQFMNREIPIIYGGFGKGQKCISDKTVAEIHDVRTFHVRESIKSNKKRFKENVDFIDLKQRIDVTDTLGLSQNSEQRIRQTETLELLQNLGYAKQSITQAEHIYILSERGYAKLIKNMDSDTAWEVHDQLMDEYFSLRQEKEQEQKPKTQRGLSALNTAMKIIIPQLEAAGVDAVQRTYFLKDTYATIGINVPMVRKEQEKLYELTEIAQVLGVYSKTGNPHAQAIGAIVGQLDIDEDNIVKTSFSKNGHTDISNQYKESVLHQVEGWLKENDFPTSISNGAKRFSVAYKDCKVYA